MDELKAIADRLEKSVDKTNAMSAKARMELDALAEVQSEERLKMQEMNNAQISDMRKHYGRIIMGLIITLAIILGGIVGGTIYLIANYDFAVATYQNISSDNNSNATIYDGIEYTRN